MLIAHYFDLGPVLALAAELKNLMILPRLVSRCSRHSSSTEHVYMYENWLASYMAISAVLCQTYWLYVGIFYSIDMYSWVCSINTTTLVIAIRELVDLWNLWLGCC